jgi:hypothetical protein
MDQHGALLLLEALEAPCACEGGERDSGGNPECRWNPLFRGWRRDLVANLPLYLEPDMPRRPSNSRGRDFSANRAFPRGIRQRG